MIKTDDAKSVARVSIAHALAQSLVDGFDQAVEEGCPLTNKQQTCITEMAIMIYHDAVDSVEMQINVSASLLRVARRDKIS